MINLFCFEQRNSAMCEEFLSFDKKEDLFDISSDATERGVRNAEISGEVLERDAL